MERNEATAKIHTSRGLIERNAVPVKPAGEIHIYQGVCGYKLSIGNRHLTLGELRYIVDKMNGCGNQRK